MRRGVSAVMWGAAMLVVLAACGTGRGDGASTGEATPFPANQGRLNEIAGAVRAAGEQRFPDAFAGVAVDTDQDAVLVWRKASPAFDGYLAGQPWHSSVKMMDARHSRAELQPAFDRLRADTEEWNGRGIVLHELSIRQDGSCVEVGAQDPAKAEGALAGHYPGAALCVVQGQGRVPLGGPRSGTPVAG
ncbi:hypothetical protein [Allorhizocola rhizosphaerae]|uniref:hypothetical protein n=1 Tax=Allorhizocola rhizosphaerae TaxID=1872709 RepID=UPI0013C2D031|nr:hypothetical protein [Allorhizocola rhizosphaerae]